MSETQNPKNYENMIEELQKFASMISKASETLNTLTAACVQVIGGEDKAVAGIYDRISLADAKYQECSETALQIAAAMQEEYDQMTEENWDDDE